MNTPPTMSSSDWFARAQHSIPGGVSSPVRAFKAVGGHPRYFERGAGSRIWDVEGNEYLDLVGSWGPMIAGHAHPHVLDAVQKAVSRSFSFGAPSHHEVLLAEEMKARVAPLDFVRFVSSGTEAVMTALRLARAATSRTMVIKFAGCYHGHVDSMLVAAGSGVVTLGLANSPGVTPGQVQDTLVLPYNDIEALSQAFSQYGDQIAAVITESVPANMGVVPPVPGFTRELRALTQQHGALLIFDEVMTGFRIARDGWWGAYAKPEDVTPDLFTYGKVIGGGFPVAAVGGRANIMELLAPVGSVYQAGTLSGNPVATAAGLATLELMTADAYELLDTRASQVGTIVSDALTREGVPHSYQQSGNLFSFFFYERPVTNFDEAKLQNSDQFAVFFHALLSNGISIPPSAFEAWFVSTAITDDDLEHLAGAASQAAQAAAAWTPGSPG
jgi:glutamate-1-semialdehyde 2,1-aminomutase